MQQEAIHNRSADIEIAVSALLGRMAVELAGIAESANSTQHALGNTIDQVSDHCDVPIVEFQALDRMQQKLEDLSKLSELLSDTTSAVPNIFVSSSQLSETLRLSSLTDRLEGKEKPTSRGADEIGSMTLF